MAETPDKRVEFVSMIPKADNRFGRKLGQNRYFPKDERFPTKDAGVGPPQYLLKPLISERVTAFGTSTREDWGKIFLQNIPERSL